MIGVLMPATQKLFMTEPGNNAAISITDVNQGSLGDCYVCSAIASLSLERPDYITDMIHDNGDGTQSVRLYLTASSTYAFEASSFKAAPDSSIWVTVHDSELGQGMNNSGQLVVNYTQEIWPQVIENAIAQLAGGYNVLNYGGNPAGIMSELTGASVSKAFFALGGAPMSTASQLRADLTAKDMVTFETGTPNNYNLVSNHSYTLKSIDTVNGVDYASFRNPWGYGDPMPIPVSDLSNAFTSVEVGNVPAVSTINNVSYLDPAIKSITGNRDGGITLVGTSSANSTVTLYNTVAGVSTIIGTSTASNSGAWNFTSHSSLRTTAINSYTISAQDSAGHAASMMGQFLLTSTGVDTLTGTAGQADVFAIMSFKGSDLIQGFETSAAFGAMHDVINLSGRGIASFNQLKPLISGAESAVILLGGSKTVTISHVSASILTAADFRFS